MRFYVFSADGMMVQVAKTEGKGKRRGDSSSLK